VDGRGSIPGSDFSVFHSVQAGSGDHSASYAMSMGSFPGLKRPTLEADDLSSSIAYVKNVELYLHSPALLRSLMLDL
jgi:hypothetical protein